MVLAHSRCLSLPDSTGRGANEHSSFIGLEPLLLAAELLSTRARVGILISPENRSITVSIAIIQGEQHAIAFVHSSKFAQYLIWEIPQQVRRDALD